MCAQKQISNIRLSAFLMRLIALRITRRIKLLHAFRIATRRRVPLPQYPIQATDQKRIQGIKKGTKVPFFSPYHVIDVYRIPGLMYFNSSK